jgi:pimeloyl-ACP methyl ester carboxylesterase
MTTEIPEMPPILQRSQNIAKVFERRTRIAWDRYNGRLAKAAKAFQSPVPFANPWTAWGEWARYAVDSAQRSILFLDTLRQRGNAYHEHTEAGSPPLLHFEHETVLDARTFERPVNYALVSIVPPKGVTIDPESRPFVIIDPRAGHGPGIGGFKEDSEVGVALRAGHPVYFVIFFPDPEPGQTLPDVCAAEQIFVHKVRELHPRSPKPAVVGNCQGGWAAMMLAASDPESTGPLVINGAPMSYWGGAWSEGEGDNPMRYSGGLLGGTWLASMSADLGNGKFDGAHLVSNFAQLNPANALWDKYYNLYSKVDTEAPRFLEFERWWGGFYLMNREEIEWITQNLFIGNSVWKSATGPGGKAFDLREIRQPIVLFASMGDNITPPQQAFNWVADVYGSTDEIKARGQVIVGLVHENVGHLGIFVSGKVAVKEHAQIVEVLGSIEALPPGLYAMQITETKGRDGSVGYEVSFEERQLEDITARLNRFERKDEEAFQAVARVAELNQKAYELYAQPVVQAVSTEATAELGRRLNPMRLEQGAASDRNPFLAWVGPAAEAVKSTRRPVAADSPLKQLERAGSEMISASLDYYRDVRDAISEAQFFQTFGVMFPAFHPGFFRATAAAAGEPAVEGRDLPVVREALAAIEEGGYAEALARAACLLARKGEPFPLARIELKAKMAEEYRDLLPELASDQWHRIRGRQEIICRYEPEVALAALPKLLASATEREQFLTVVDKLMADPRIPRDRVSTTQRTMARRIHGLLDAAAAPAPARRTRPRLAVVPKAAPKKATRRA